MQKVKVLILIMALTLSGCAGMSDSNRTRAEGAGVGAAAGTAIGALLGQIIGGDTGSTLVGAAIGGAIGGAAGLAYGDHVAKQKEKYASQEDWLDACIASAEKVNSETRTYNEKLAADLKSLKKEVADLNKGYKKKKVEKSALVAKKKAIDDRLAESNKQLEVARFELENQEAAAKDDGNAGSTAKEQALNKEIAQLKQSISELEQKTTTLASLSASMAV